jgi:hypothetical protein
VNIFTELYRFPGFFNYLEPFLLVLYPIIIITMSESIGIFTGLVIEMKIKKVNKDMRSKGDLLIGGRSFIEIVFVPFPSRGIRVNVTAR